MAGEIGDWPCDGVSTLEEIASLRGIQAALQPKDAAQAASPGEEFSVAQVLKSAENGDEGVKSLLERMARTLGLVIGQMSRAFNPGKIILAGAFQSFGSAFLERLKTCYHETSRSADLPPLAVSDLGEFNGAIGAAALAVHQWKPDAKKESAKPKAKS